MQYINTLTVLALVVASFALIVAVPVLYASSEDSGRSNRLILLGSAVWVALVLLNWGELLRGLIPAVSWNRGSATMAGIQSALPPWPRSKDVF